MRMYVFAIVYQKASGENVIAPVLIEANSAEDAADGARETVEKQNPGYKNITYSLVYTLEDFLLGWRNVLVKQSKRD